MAAVGITPLHFSIFRAKDQQAIEIIERGEADLDAEDSGGRTPMHMACYRDQIDLVKRLVAAGANAKKADGFGNTPLHAAAGAGGEKVIEYLATELKMPLHTKNQDGLTVLEVAQKHCPGKHRMAIVKLLQAIVDARQKNENVTENSTGGEEAKDKIMENSRSSSLNTSGDDSTGIIPRRAGADRGLGGTGRSVGGIKSFPIRVPRQLDGIKEEDQASDDLAEGRGWELVATGSGDDAATVISNALASLLAKQDKMFEMLLEVQRQQELIKIRLQEVSEGKLTSVSTEEHERQLQANTEAVTDALEGIGTAIREHKEEATVKPCLWSRVIDVGLKIALTGACLRVIGNGFTSNNSSK